MQVKRKNLEKIRDLLAEIPTNELRWEESDYNRVNLAYMELKFLLETNKTK